MDVAIKKFAISFINVLHAKRTYRELRLMMQLHHKNVRFSGSARIHFQMLQIVRFLDTFTPQQSAFTFNDLYIVMELCEGNLKHVGIMP